jgi:hypothetical protein
VARILRFASGVLVSLVLSALLLEIALRVVAPFSRIVRLATWSPMDMDTFEHIHVAGDLAQFVPTMFPGGSSFMGMRLTKDGFWTPPYTKEKRPGTFRMLILGDSFAFSSGGVPFERMWLTLVAEQLQRAWGKAVEPVNLGIPGAGPRLEGRVYDVEGAALQPDLVILALFLGNDLTDESDARPLRRSMLVRLLENLGQLADFLRVTFYAGRIAAYGSSPDWTPGRYVYDPTTPTFPMDVFLHIERQRARVFTDAAWAHERIRRVADVMAELQARVFAAGGTFALVVIPDEVEVNADLRAAVVTYLEEVGQGHPEFDIDGVHQLLASELSSRGMAFLDLLPTLRDAARAGSPYRPRDTHWDDRGNRVSADAIAQWILHDNGKLGLTSLIAPNARP